MSFEDVECVQDVLSISNVLFQTPECSQRMMLLTRCVVTFHKPLPLQESKKSQYSQKKSIWKNLLKLVISDQSLSQNDITVLSVKPQRGKTWFLMFLSEAEAEVWKAGIDEACLLGESENGTKGFRKALRCKAMKHASDALHQTKAFLQTKSLLVPPFGLRWHAYSPLLRAQEAKQRSSVLAIPEANLDNDNTLKDVQVQAVHRKSAESLWYDLDTLNGCTDFLCSSYMNVQALECTSLMVDHFKGSYQMGDSCLPDELRLEAWKGTTHRIVKALVDRLLLDNPSLGPCFHNHELLDQLWCASEVWVFGAVHDKIMGACKQMFALQDAALNDILSRLQKVDPAKLGVRAEYEVLVLGEALDEFRRLNHCRTPYEKAKCLQKTVMHITDGIQHLIKSCTGALEDSEALLPCTDDLLSFMLLLMARAKVRNLHANACYMDNFINLQKDTNRGELVYHITNFMAACKYLHSEAVEELLADISPPSKSVMTHSQLLSSSSRSSPPSLCTRSSSFEGSSETHGTLSSSPADSLELDSSESRWWEETCNKSSYSDHDSFCNWTASNSVNQKDFEYEITEDPFTPDINWFTERENSFFTCRIDKKTLTFPGETPDF
ncbi:hypothetical protein KP509_31G014700 [Ceratopteris richardii]|uniref:VPS9 domain-containing protein n=1 Tax=Ceratopteris richardii TaxID=49495 RepID=A0A8T2QVU2_CERRI|nr:hypothetical protein KP509_31G014700 [Ceratopteris richardii]KAH7288159.1 hypothetical protein KP509_31G014700 [Ceratopteris richardii]